MDREKIMAKVKKVTSQVLEKDESEIGDNTYFAAELGASSLQSIRLVAGFEEEFDIEMDEDKALQISTVTDAVTFIGSYLK
jgi:acyl carrier protein